MQYLVFPAGAPAQSLEGYHPSSEHPWQDASLPVSPPPPSWMEKAPMLGFALYQVACLHRLSGRESVSPWHTLTATYGMTGWARKAMGLCGSHKPVSPGPLHGDSFLKYHPNIRNQLPRPGYVVREAKLSRQPSAACSKEEVRSALYSSTHCLFQDLTMCSTSWQG